MRKALVIEGHDAHVGCGKDWEGVGQCCLLATYTVIGSGQGVAFICFGAWPYKDSVSLHTYEST